VVAQEALADERETHREPGGETRPHQRHGIPAELVAAFLVDRVPDDARIRGAALFGLGLLFLAFLRVFRLLVDHPEKLRSERARG